MVVVDPVLIVKDALITSDKVDCLHFWIRTSHPWLTVFCKSFLCNVYTFRLSHVYVHCWKCLCCVTKVVKTFGVESLIWCYVVFRKNLVLYWMYVEICSWAVFDTPIVSGTPKLANVPSLEP